VWRVVDIETWLVFPQSNLTLKVKTCGDFRGLCAVARRVLFFHLGKFTNEGFSFFCV
jgi:hypothetical protein